MIASQSPHIPAALFLLLFVSHPYHLSFSRYSGSFFTMASSQTLEPSTLYQAGSSVPRTSNPRKRARKTDRKAPLSHTQKLQAAVEHIESLNKFDLRDLLRALASERSNPRFGKYWVQFKRFAYTKLPSGEGSLPALEKPDWDNVFKYGGTARFTKILRAELSRLGKDPRCGKFQYPSTISSGYIDHLSEICDVVEAKAPQLFSLFTDLTQRHGKARTGQEQGTRRHHIFWIVSLDNNGHCSALSADGIGRGREAFTTGLVGN